MSLRRDIGLRPAPMPKWPTSAPVTQRFHIPKVFVTRAAFEADEPEDLVQCNANVVNHLLNALIEPHEIHADAMRSHGVDYYARQVARGGHAQFAADSQGQLLTHRFIREGLQSMGAQRHYEIYAELMMLLECRDPSVGQVVDRRGFCVDEARLQALDARFHAAETERPLARANADWLRTRPALQLTDDRVLDEKLERLVRSNPFREERARAWAAASRRRRRRTNDPHTLLAERLCALVDRQWLGWTARVPGRIEIAPGRVVDTVAWSGSTSEGPCLLYFVDGKACLIDRETDRLLIWLPLQS